MFYKTYVYVSAYNRTTERTEQFDKINWLPIDQRFKQSVSTSVSKLSEICPQYINEIYKTINQSNTVTRNVSLKLFQLLRTKALRQEMFAVFRDLLGMVCQMMLNCQTLIVNRLSIW